MKEHLNHGLENDILIHFSKIEMEKDNENYRENAEKMEKYRPITIGFSFNNVTFYRRVGIKIGIG